MNSELHHTIITAVYHILGLFHCMIYTAINDRTMICSIYVVLNSSHKQVRMQLRIYARLVNVISKTVACQFKGLISLILNTPIYQVVIHHKQTMINTAVIVFKLFCHRLVKICITANQGYNFQVKRGNVGVEDVMNWVQPNAL